MNLKEAFRYQNYLTNLFDVASSYLRNRQNLVHVTQFHLRNEANPDVDNVRIDATTERPYSCHNDVLLAFLNSVMEEKHNLAILIGKAKASCPIDIDAETASNSIRRNAIHTLGGAIAIKSSETKKQGNDFKFNVAGDQVRYVYDITEVKNIDFNRNRFKGMLRALSQKADEVSAAIDRCMIDVELPKFVPMFDISDSVDDAIEAFAALNDQDVSES